MLVSSITFSFSFPIQEFLSSSGGISESQQIIRYLSRYVYDHQNADTSTIQTIINLTKICCQKLDVVKDFDKDSHLKSLYYIALLPAKKVSCFLFTIFCII